MIIRKTKDLEYKRIGELSALCFEYPMQETDKTSEEIVAQKRANPQERHDLSIDSKWAAFEDDDKTMMSAMTLIPYKARFEGKLVPLVGIGGVVTLPQYRRRGCIRSIFNKILPDMYEQGVMLTYLHAFSTAFYRKFGYELACTANRWKINMAGIPKMHVDGSWKLVEQGADLVEDLKRVDEKFSQRYNCMFMNEDIDYAWARKANPFRDKVYTYVYYNAQGLAESYVTYTPREDQGDKALVCSRCIFRSLEGLRGLFAILQSMASNHSHIVVNLPEDIELCGLMPEWSFNYMFCQRFWTGMGRVVNVEAALRMARVRGEGRVVIEVKDEQIPQNNGRFDVTFVPGGENLVARTENDPDISLGVNDFSRLILGRQDMWELNFVPDIQINGDREELEKIFYRKPLFMYHRF